jgi:hypothetical protein
VKMLLILLSFATKNCAPVLHVLFKMRVFKRSMLE